MQELVSPGQIVTKITLTKKDAQTFSGYAIKCKVDFFEGPSISYDIEHHIDLFDEKYPKGIYEWNGKNFIEIENWEEPKTEQ